MVKHIEEVFQLNMVGLKVTIVYPWSSPESGVIPVSAHIIIPHLANRQSGGKNAEPSSLHSHAQIPQKVSRGNLWQHFPLLSPGLSGSSQLQSSFSICQIISIINRYNMTNTRKVGLKMLNEHPYCFPRKAFKCKTL